MLGSRNALTIAGRWGGARIGVHWAFVLLLVGAGVMGFGLQVLILLGSLIAHELAHVAAAWAVGVDVEELNLTPLGGTLRLSGHLEADPQAEVAVAVAGPFQSFLLAGLAQMISPHGLWQPELVQFCYDVNVSLAFFNLLPALPLDGGRALRGLLANRLGFRRVSQWMVLSGRLCGVMLAGWGGVALAAGQPYWAALIGGPYLVWMAGQEAEHVLLRSMGQLLRRRGDVVRQRVMRARSLVAAADVRLAEILPHLAARRYHLVVVVAEDLEPMGQLSEAEIVAAFQARGPEVRLAELLA